MPRDFLRTPSSNALFKEQESQHLVGEPKASDPDILLTPTPQLEFNIGRSFKLKVFI